MAKKLYVGNLSYNAQEGDLTELFEQFGTVNSTKLITDRDTGKSKGFAFVEFALEEAADLAVAQLNGQDFLGRNLRVNEAIERPRYN